MAKTLLELINEVGKNLRRSTGSTYTAIDQNADSIFIMQAINEAKRQVEGAWKWDCMRETITFASVGGTRSYDLGDAGVVVTGNPARDRSYVAHTARHQLQFWDKTADSEYRLTECPRDYAEHIATIDPDTDIERPSLVAIHPNSDGLEVRFPWAPTGVRTYKVEIYNPQDDLAVAGTTLTVPWRPVVLAATALCFDERGEELGGASSLWWSRFDDSLSREIGRDATAFDMQLIADTNYDTAGYWNA